MAEYKEYASEETVDPASVPACPVETCTRLIGSKWKLLILRDLTLGGTMRFGQLKRSLGSISQKVLTSNLRELEESGIVLRRVYPEVPPRVEYSLTEVGLSLKPVIDAMWSWGEGYQQLVREGEVPGRFS